MIDKINAAIRSIPDFPKPGIMFKDITPVLRDPDLFAGVVKLIADRWRGKGLDAVAAVDARGFIMGGAVAYELGIGFVPVRKAGKLPWDTVSASYALEYGTNTVEMHADGVKTGEKILLIDDLLATGGTAAAAVSLIEKLGASIAGIEFMLELTFLNGRAALAPHDVYSLIQVD
ncbi:MAG: adenine phosphoribosyltransferase [Lentisphaeria bacterium]|nr:adenine phosphoribosyltransferase [Lentisphaeria bacterium]